MRNPDGNLNVGTMEGKALEVVEMINGRKMEVMCVRETKWKGDRAVKMAEGYNMLHAGGDGWGNGVGIIVNVEISKEVARVERWQERIIAVWTMIRQHMICVICVYGPQTGRTELDLLVVRQQQLRRVKDCKALAGECVTTQHKPAVFEVRMNMWKEEKTMRPTNIKWWKCKDDMMVEYWERVGGKYQELDTEKGTVEGGCGPYKDAFACCGGGAAW